MVGGSLAANDVVFANERKKIQTRSAGQAVGSNTRFVAYRAKCGIHKISLIRKPLILSIPGFWITIVRLGHLFESYSFKSKFRSASLEVITRQFRRIEVQSLPPQAADWKRKTMSIMETWRKHEEGHLQDVIGFMAICNGNPFQPEIDHYCLPGCCGGDAEALDKLLHYFLRIFGHGFPLPLLKA